MRFRLLVLLAIVALVVPLAFVISGPDRDTPDEAGLAASTTRHSRITLTTTSEFARGKTNGISTTRDRLTWERAAKRRTIDGVRYGMGAWHSAWVTPRHGFTEVIPSWDARSSRNGWVKVMVRATSTTGQTSRWKTLAQWHKPLGRRTFGRQADRVAEVATDTFRARPGVTLRKYQLRVELLRRDGTRSTPFVRSLHAVASRLGGVPTTSTPLYSAQSLAVPEYSQMIHRGEYPEYGGGGQAWCSPTSLSMILGYYGRLPGPRAYTWVSSRYPDRWVAQLAKQVYDSGYDGAGNWAFNTAFAATRVPTAYVTRLTNLRDVERFIARDIPVQVSISFGRGQLRGAPIRATAGHLVVISGFDADGDVIVNDPAAPDNRTVRRTYDRAQFERAWLGKSGGLAYVVAGAGRSVPAGY